MVAIPYKADVLDFTTPNELPPRNEQAEDAILGGILLDPTAIFRIWGRLKPEHFQVTANREIYKACCKLARQNKPTDLLSLSSYLNDKKLLAEIGGRNKLANLVEGTVSAVNIDELAALVIEKAVRKDLIKLGNETIRLGYDTQVDIEEVLESFKRRVETVVELETVKTEEELIKSRHDRLIDKLKRIYTTVAEPSLKHMRLKALADDTRTSIGFLESLYLKSLVGTCTKLMDYEDLKQAAGSSVRRWLQQGLVPLATTILLAADGGIGKTKLVYSLAKNLIEGTQFGDFLATGEKRRILFYQGDEQEGDMLQSLQMLGYEQGDLTKYIRIRFGWSFENMATLTQDLNEFKPDFVVFDSLSFGSRFSTVRESDSEFARPLLEASGLAAQHNCTFLFIHHANKGGEVRGTTAIRNAVSEVWRLTKSNQPEDTQYDRVLEIDKSRSRSSGKRYKLYFDPDTLAFKFLGEEVAPNSDVSNRGIRGKILEHFRCHPNTKFTAEEISQFLQISSGNCRRTLNDISSDGLLSIERKPGKAYTYYLEFTDFTNGYNSKGINRIHSTEESELQAPDLPLRGDHTQYNDQGDQRNDQQDDHLCNAYSESDTAKADHLIIENDPQKKGDPKNQGDHFGSDDQLRPKDALGKVSRGDRQGDQDFSDDHPDHLYGSPRKSELIQKQAQSANKDKADVPNVVEPIQQSLIPGQETQVQTKQLEQIRKIYNTCLGQIKAMAEEIDPKNWRFTIITPDGIKAVEKIEKLGAYKPDNKLKNVLDNWLKSLTFEVIKTDYAPAQWVSGCKWVESIDHHVAMQKRHKFITPDGTLIDAFGFGCDRIRVSES